MTGILRDSDSDAQRGIIETATEAPPLSIGLVIGVGGAGIQTISRVRSAVRAMRPDAAATPSIEFLGIDAVDLSKQNPALPPGIDLESRQFYNLTETPFDAAEYVRQIGGGDSPLSKWWDMELRPPPGPLIEGLAQHRMLGRLAWYRESDKVKSRIADALDRCVRQTQANMAIGAVAPGAQGMIPKVFVVGSSSGGTGSSGLLEVLYKVWEAARALGGLTPEIRLFTYLPGIFQSAILETSANPSGEIVNMESNTFGFFRELDHFINKSDELHRKVSKPALDDEIDPARVEAGDLVKQVYVIDAALRGGARLSKVTDFYEIAAEAIYQFLMTDAGRPQIAQNGVNTENFLRALDAHGHRRIYCGLGIAAITYPGDTYRNHLVNRFADWFTRQQLLSRPVDLGSQVSRNKEAKRLIDEVRALHGSVVASELPPKGREFLMLAETASETLRGEHSDEIVSRLVTSIANTEPVAVAQLQTQLRTVRASAIANLDSIVVNSVLDTGKGVPFAIEMVHRAETELRGLRDDVAETRSTNQTAVPRLKDESEKLRANLRGLEQKRFVLPKNREKAADELGRALRAWGTAVIAEHRADAEVRFFDEAIERLANLRHELESSEEVLSKLANSFHERWRSDELVGKDSGPVDTTVLIPADAQPEIEDSHLSQTAFSELLEVLGNLDMDEVIRELYAKWRGGSSGGAIFGLGSQNPDLQKGSKAALLRELNSLADFYVLQSREIVRATEPGAEAQRLILPRSLLDAAERTDGGESLKRALRGLQDLSRKSCWSWDVSRLGDLSKTTVPEPSPSTVIIRPRSLTDEIDRFFQAGNGLTIIDSSDDERIVALTTEFGVSAHALTGVGACQRSYERALRGIRGGDRTQKRPHLDRSWVTDLDPLIPLYFDKSIVLRDLAEILMVDRLLADEGVADRLFDPTTRSRRPKLFEKRDDGSRLKMIGTIFAGEEGYWRPGRSVDLGERYKELIGRLGRLTEYRQAASAIVQAAVIATGRARAIEVLRQILEGEFLPQQGIEQRDRAEGEAIDDIVAALIELQCEYEQMEMKLGTVLPE